MISRKLGLLSILVATCSLANAQSSVTLYGVLDTGITYINNTGGASVVKMDDGVYYPNRWGMKGVEDLGGGLKAIFTLEGGFSVDSGALGQGGLLFGRQAFVGLQSDYGKITLGHQYDSVYDFINDFQVGENASGYGLHPGDLDRTAGERLDNAIKYTSPNIRGFTVSGLYSFSNTAGSFHDGSAWSAGGSYEYGPFSLGLAYISQTKTTIDPYGQLGVKSLLGQTVATVDTTSGQVTDTESSFELDKKTTFAIGGSWEATKKLTFYANFTDTMLKKSSVSSYMRVYEGGAQYYIRPDLQVTGAYLHATLEGNRWNQASASIMYLLSKQTMIVFGVDATRVSGNVDAEIGYGFTPSSTSTQADVRLGITHKF